MRDDLGDRMKSHYEARTRYSLPRRTYTLVRVDGKTFQPIPLMREVRKPGGAIEKQPVPLAEYRAQLEDLDMYLKLQPNGPASERARRRREAALKTLAKSHPQD